MRRRLRRRGTHSENKPTSTGELGTYSIKRRGGRIDGLSRRWDLAGPASGIFGGIFGVQVPEALWEGLGGLWSFSKRKTLGHLIHRDKEVRSESVSSRSGNTSSSKLRELPPIGQPPKPRRLHAEPQHNIANRNHHILL